MGPSSAYPNPKHPWQDVEQRANREANREAGTEGDSVGVLVPADLSDAERRAKQKAEDDREKFAHRVSLVLENGEAQSLTEIAKRLLAEGCARPVVTVPAWRASAERPWHSAGMEAAPPIV